MKTAMQLPAIDDVAHEIQLIAGVELEKRQEQVCFAVSASKVNIGNEYGPHSRA